MRCDIILSKNSIHKLRKCSCNMVFFILLNFMIFFFKFYIFRRYIQRSSFIFCFFFFNFVSSYFKKTDRTECCIMENPRFHKIQLLSFHYSNLDYFLLHFFSFSVFFSYFFVVLLKIDFLHSLSATLSSKHFIFVYFVLMP